MFTRPLHRALTQGEAARMANDLSQSPATPGVMDIDRYAVLADQGATLIAIFNFVAAAAITVILMVGTWYPGAVALYKLMGMTPGILATILAVFIGPRVWRRIVIDGRRFSAAKGAIAGLLTVVLVQIITIEVFLAVFFGFLRLLEPGSTHLDEFPALILMAPIYSVPTVGVFTLPTGTVIGLAVAAYCQHKLKA